MSVRASLNKCSCFGRFSLHVRCHMDVQTWMDESLTPASLEGPQRWTKHKVGPVPCAEETTLMSTWAHLDPTRLMHTSASRRIITYTAGRSKIGGSLLPNPPMASTPCTNVQFVGKGANRALRQHFLNPHRTHRRAMTRFVSWHRYRAVTCFPALHSCSDKVSQQGDRITTKKSEQSQTRTSLLG